MNATAARMLLVVCLFIPSYLRADQQTASQDAPDSDVVQDEAAADSYLLRYQFNKGQRLRWKVAHLVTIETQIKGTTQKAETRSISTKVWRVTSVGQNGLATFVHLVDDIDMWQKVTGRQEIRYNSKEDSSPPPEYENAAAQVGIPLATVSLASTGTVVERVNSRQQPGFGGGQITIPLPESMIKVGDSWNQPHNITVKLKDGRPRKIKCRQFYTLEKVRRDTATISMDTQVLTPIDDPRIRVQLVQRLSHGTVKFNIREGRIEKQQMDLDETVLAFNGPDSSMKYLARFTEELLQSDDGSTSTDDQESVTGTSGPSDKKPPKQPRQARGRTRKLKLRR